MGPAENIRTILQTIRPPFLLLSPVCIFLGYASAVYCGAQPAPWLTMLVIFGALCAHVSVNTFNEYADFQSGLDELTRRTPFSGGSGALQQNPAAATGVLAPAITTLMITIVLGLYFIYLRGWSIVILLVVGVSIIVAYTSWLNRQPLLCLLAPGLGFGLLYVVGAHVVLSGSYHVVAFYTALLPFLLANNLLLLNQYPDIEADRAVGRRHLPISRGVHTSNLVYLGQACLALVTVVAGVQLAMLPAACLLALPALLPALLVFYGLMRHGRDTDRLIPYMALNVFTVLVAPLLLGIGLLMS